MKIGILALQGAFIEHEHILSRLKVDSVEVRLPGEFEGLRGLIIPGGESTAMLNLMRNFGIIEPLKILVQSGLPVWGVCAGLICLAKSNNNSGNSGIETLALMDMVVQRNAFGRQVDSFETKLTVPVLGKKPFPAVFIRAPIIEKVGARVETLARLSDGTIVAARQGNLLATSFHPELTSDVRFHRYFLDMVPSH
jgi:pyridoxal 5'-phosphate synthase pdxT subunit